MIMISSVSVCIVLWVWATSASAESAAEKASCEPGPHNLPNPFPAPDARAPEHFYFLLPTTAYSDDGESDAGLIVFEVNRTWAPIGVDRFYALAQDNYYDCAALFRVVPSFVVQWGIASDPDLTAKWGTHIADDPVLESNVAGTVSFATAGPGTRTAQIFVNTVDNSRLDGQGFAPFAKVVQGMDVLTGSALNVPNPVPDQQQYKTKGNAWLLANYPDTDIVKGVRQPEGGASTSGVATSKIRYSLDDTGDIDVINSADSLDDTSDGDLNNSADSLNDTGDVDVVDSADTLYDASDVEVINSADALDDTGDVDLDISAAALSFASIIYSLMRVISLIFLPCV